MTFGEPLMSRFLATMFARASVIAGLSSCRHGEEMLAVQGAQALSNIVNPQAAWAVADAE